MIEKKSIICIVCPQGCRLEIDIMDDSIEKISGYKCKRGVEYARQECTHPVRTLTTTVRLDNGVINVAPVKTDRPIPKNLIFECMKEINRYCLQAPVKMGDIVIENVLGTGSNIIATGNIPAANGEE